MFWDKMERANYILEAVIETADRPIDDRVVAWLLSGPLGDGGQWDMFVSLMRKHGVVPKTVMPETESSGQLNADERGPQLPGAAGGPQHPAHCTPKKAALDSMREAKQEALQAIYQILCIHLGNPPAKTSTGSGRTRTANFTQ